MLFCCDYCEIIKKIGNWEIELTPDSNFIEENNYPDWYVYQKINVILRSKNLILEEIYNYNSYILMFLKS